MTIRFVIRFVRTKRNQFRFVLWNCLAHKTKRNSIRFVRKTNRTKRIPHDGLEFVLCAP